MISVMRELVRCVPLSFLYRTTRHFLPCHHQLRAVMHVSRDGVHSPECAMGSTVSRALLGMYLELCCQSYSLTNLRGSERGL